MCDEPCNGEPCLLTMDEPAYVALASSLGLNDIANFLVALGSASARIRYIIQLVIDRRVQQHKRLPPVDQDSDQTTTGSEKVDGIRCLWEVRSRNGNIIYPRQVASLSMTRPSSRSTAMTCQAPPKKMSSALFTVTTTTESEVSPFHPCSPRRHSARSSPPRSSQSCRSAHAPTQFDLRNELRNDPCAMEPSPRVFCIRGSSGRLHSGR